MTRNTSTESSIQVNDICMIQKIHTAINNPHLLKCKLQTRVTREMFE